MRAEDHSMCARRECGRDVRYDVYRVWWVRATEDIRSKKVAMKGMFTSVGCVLLGIKVLT